MSEPFKRRSTSDASEAKFRQRVAERGGQVLESEWLGVCTPHLVRCSRGHERKVRPHSVNTGKGLCATCAGSDPAAAWDAFRQRVLSLGGVVLEEEWLGKDKPHLVRCAQGHESHPRPGHVRDGGGICRTCAGQDQKVIEAAFRCRVAELGGIVLEGRWLGALTPHRVRCQNGHDCAPRPKCIQQGQGICRTCAGVDPKAAEENFRKRVADLGGVVLEPVWLGKDKPHRVRCPQGHEATPSPTSIQQGRGICRFCAGMQWDVFYIVMHDGSDRIKFGITSGDHRDRLRRHARAGYKTLIRLLTDLPGSVAPDLERFVKSALALAGETPIHGREYFSAGALALVLDVVDNFPLQLANCVSTARDDLPGYPAL